MLPCACANLRRATRAVTQLYEQELRENGLRVTQFTLLQVLEPTQPVAQGRLGEILALDTTTLSRTLRPLEGKGWIRSHPGDDQRERHWSLTTGGRKKLASAKRHWNRAQERLVTRLGKKEWNELQATLVATAEAALQA
jgi:DNA-binding MarR family transcriptional regulator